MTFIAVLGASAAAKDRNRDNESRPPAAAVSGAALLAGSALTRFGVFAAGMASARDPKYTVEPQRERLERAQAGAF